jgi:hypothetical protein
MLAQIGVEIRKRFVEQHESRRPDDRPGEGDTLLLSARQFVRVARALVREPDAVERLRDESRGVARSSAPPERIADVLPNGHVGPQCVILEHHRQPAPLGRYVDAMVVDDCRSESDAAGIQSLDAGDRPQQGGLSRPGWTEQHGERPGPDVEVDALQCLDRSIALGRAPDADAVAARRAFPGCSSGADRFDGAHRAPPS